MAFCSKVPLGKATAVSTTESWDSQARGAATAREAKEASAKVEANILKDMKVVLGLNARLQREESCEDLVAKVRKGVAREKFARKVQKAGRVFIE